MNKTNTRRQQILIFLCLFVCFLLYKFIIIVPVWSQSDIR